MSDGAVREEWIIDGTYAGPRHTHSGACCDSCIEDLNMGFLDYNVEAYCCCRERAASPPDMEDRIATLHEANRRHSERDRRSQ